MQFGAGRPTQETTQGAILCQDWPGFGTISAAHYLAASDVPDDANVGGMVAFFFACFAGGTPKVDQFILKPDQLAAAATTPPLAPRPFMAALPRRLLAHPKGSALAIIAHVDRAWACSIQTPGMTGGQIMPFRNGLQFMMQGHPIGHVIRDQFGSRFAACSHRARRRSRTACLCPAGSSATTRKTTSCLAIRRRAFGSISSP
jgi:hypothetical protein